jgi:hypothetical protein
MEPSPDARPRSGIDEWGAVWANISSMMLGQVKDFPMKGWEDFENMTIPDVNDPRRWTCLEGV